jgi:DNA-binding response OmpR family regulator
MVKNPILMFIPTYDEQHILDYYTTGVDDCVVKPISPAVFYAKVKAWLRHSKMQPVPVMDELRAGDIILKPDQRVLVRPDGKNIKLTDLDGTLVASLDKEPGHVLIANTS